MLMASKKNENYTLIVIHILYIQYLQIIIKYKLNCTTL